MAVGLCPPPHIAPYEIQIGDDKFRALKNGTKYFGLLFPDGVVRGSWATFLYDESGVREQLRQNGYAVDGPYTINRTP